MATGCLSSNLPPSGIRQVTWLLAWSLTGAIEDRTSVSASSMAKLSSRSFSRDSMAGMRSYAAFSRRPCFFRNAASASPRSLRALFGPSRLTGLNSLPFMSL